MVIVLFTLGTRISLLKPNQFIQTTKFIATNLPFQSLSYSNLIKGLSQKVLSNQTNYILWGPPWTGRHYTLGGYLSSFRQVKGQFEPNRPQSVVAAILNLTLGRTIIGCYAFLFFLFIVDANKVRHLRQRGSSYEFKLWWCLTLLPNL